MLRRAAFLLCLLPAALPFPSPARADAPPPEGVTVELLEGVPDRKGWDFKAPEPADDVQATRGASGAGLFAYTPRRRPGGPYRSTLTASCRSAWSARTRAAIASTIGTARGRTQGSWRPRPFSVVSWPWRSTVRCSAARGIVTAVAAEPGASDGEPLLTDDGVPVGGPGSWQAEPVGGLGGGRRSGVNRPAVEVAASAEVDPAEVEEQPVELVL